MEGSGGRDELAIRIQDLAKITERISANMAQVPSDRRNREEDLPVVEQTLLQVMEIGCCLGAGLPRDRALSITRAFVTRYSNSGPDKAALSLNRPLREDGDVLDRVMEIAEQLADIRGTRRGRVQDRGPPSSNSNSRCSHCYAWGNCSCSFFLSRPSDSPSCHRSPSKRLCAQERQQQQRQEALQQVQQQQQEKLNSAASPARAVYHFRDKFSCLPYSPLNSFADVHSGPSDADVHSGLFDADVHSGPFDADVHSGPFDADVHSGPFVADVHSGPFDTDVHSGSFVADVHSGSDFHRLPNLDSEDFSSEIFPTEGLSGCAPVVSMPHRNKRKHLFSPGERRSATFKFKYPKCKPPLLKPAPSRLETKETAVSVRAPPPGTEESFWPVRHLFAL